MSTSNIWNSINNFHKSIISFGNQLGNKRFQRMVDVKENNFGLCLFKGHLKWKNINSLYRLHYFDLVVDLLGQIDELIEYDLEKDFDSQKNDNLTSELSWTWGKFFNRNDKFSLNNFFYANSCRYYDILDPNCSSTIAEIIKLINTSNNSLSLSTEKAVKQLLEKKSKNIINHGSVLTAGDTLLQIRGMSCLLPMMFRSIPYFDCLELSTRASLDQILDKVPFDVPEEDLIALKYTEKINFIKQVIKATGPDLENKKSYKYDQVRFLLPVCIPTSFCISFRKDNHEHILGLYREGLSKVKSLKRKVRLLTITKLISSFTYHQHLKDRTGNIIPAEKILKNHYNVATFPIKPVEKSDDPLEQIIKIATVSPDLIHPSKRYFDYFVNNPYRSWSESIDEEFYSHNMFEDPHYEKCELLTQKIMVKQFMSLGAARDLLTHRTVKANIHILEPNKRGLYSSQDLDSVAVWMYNIQAEKANKKYHQLLAETGEEIEFDTEENGININGEIIYKMPDISHYQRLIETGNKQFWPKGQLNDPNDPTNLWALSLGSMVEYVVSFDLSSLAYMSALRVQPKAHPEYVAAVLMLNVQAQMGVEYITNYQTFYEGCKEKGPVGMFTNLPFTNITPENLIIKTIIDFLGAFGCDDNEILLRKIPWKFYLDWFAKLRAINHKEAENLAGLYKDWLHEKIENPVLRSRVLEVLAKGKLGLPGLTEDEDIEPKIREVHTAFCKKYRDRIDQYVPRNLLTDRSIKLILLHLLQTIETEMYKSKHLNQEYLNRFKNLFMIIVYFDFQLHKMVFNTWSIIGKTKFPENLRRLDGSLVRFDDLPDLPKEELQSFASGIFRNEENLQVVLSLSRVRELYKDFYSEVCVDKLQSQNILEKLHSVEDMELVKFWRSIESSKKEYSERLNQPSEDPEQWNKQLDKKAREDQEDQDQLDEQDRDEEVEYYETEYSQIEYFRNTDENKKDSDDEMEDDENK